jgi:hypothetical protein
VEVERRRLFQPLDRMFEEQLKPRLDSLLTRTTRFCGECQAAHPQGSMRAPLGRVDRRSGFGNTREVRAAVRSSAISRYTSVARDDDARFTPAPRAATLRPRPGAPHRRDPDRAGRR